MNQSERWRKPFQYPYSLIPSSPHFIAGKRTSVKGTNDLYNTLFPYYAFQAAGLRCTRPSQIPSSVYSIVLWPYDPMTQSSKHDLPMHRSWCPFCFLIGGHCPISPKLLQSALLLCIILHPRPGPKLESMTAHSAEQYDFPYSIVPWPYDPVTPSSRNDPPTSNS